MKRFLFAAVAACVCAGLIQSAEAGNRGGNGGIRISGGNRGFVQKQNVHVQRNFQVQKFHQPHNFQKQVFHKNIFIAKPHFNHQHLKFQNYHLHYGKKFSHGYCYVGHTHQHWASTIWSPDCGCYVYYCPYTLAWYYWCQPDGCFYPISYCPHGTFVF